MTRCLAAALHALLVLGVGLLFAAPLILLLIASLHPPGSVPVAGALWPSAPGAAGYAQVFAAVPMWRGLLNSLLIAAVAVPVSVATASLAGLGLTLLTPRGRFLGVVILVAAASIPYSAIWLPRFLLMQGLGLTGTWLPLWLPALMGGSPLLVLLYFVAIRRLPVTPWEAAQLEGLTWFAIWWRVVLPQLPAVNAAAVVLATAWSWANVIDPLLYIHSERGQTAPQMLYSLQLLGVGHWSVLMAGAVVVVAPLFVVGLGVVLLQAVRSRHA